jgi:hypothetical protein
VTLAVRSARMDFGIASIPTRANAVPRSKFRANCRIFRRD